MMILLGSSAQLCSSFVADRSGELQPHSVKDVLTCRFSVHIRSVFLPDCPRWALFHAVQQVQKPQKGFVLEETKPDEAMHLQIQMHLTNIGRESPSVHGTSPELVQCNPSPAHTQRGLQAHQHFLLQSHCLLLQAEPNLCQGQCPSRNRCQNIQLLAKYGP